jgi:cytochrome c peroxidase
MRWLCLAGLLASWSLWGHDAHGRSNAPPEARRLRNPAVRLPTEADFNRYIALCGSCHGPDGRSRTKAAGAMTTRPTDLTNYLMESMKDGEIYWVVAHGIETRMPAFAAKLNEADRWQMVMVVRELRNRQRAKEKSQLGPYEWQLPPGFPFPNVPADNPMTAEKVALGRHLFYDKRLSLNQTQSCATCHRQDKAFADPRGRGLGSTGELHPRGPMSLVNVAYAPVLTWANPNMRQLEQQALVPLFGDHPVEMGMAGKEDLLQQRLQALPVYRKLFAAAFPAEAKPFTVANVTKAIASFQRTILSGDSPYDEYQRGDDPNAISAAAKRGEALFFSERLECFHCHGGFNFTGTVDYLGKGMTEVEFHNTSLYAEYKEPNVGLYEFTQEETDKGKFKAPTLRNIALTAPYMHDGSVKTLAEAIDHYAKGGRADHPNRSEFVKQIELTAGEREDLVQFLLSLTDRKLLTNPQLANPWAPPVVTASPPPKYIVRGEVVRVFPEDGAVAVYHEAVPGLMEAMAAPNAMEFLVADKQFLASLTPGTKFTAGVRKRGADYFLEPIRKGVVKK